MLVRSPQSAKARSPRPLRSSPPAGSRMLPLTFIAMPRIVSFLPAATEITCALGAGDELVGRSHECDYPPEVRALPVVSKPALPLEGLSQREIDSAVAAHLATGESIYQVDEVLLDKLSPDVVFTQDLCQVCAPSGNELSRALRDLAKP